MKQKHEYVFTWKDGVCVTNIVILCVNERAELTNPVRRRITG
jgi:hypothetical protein